VGEGLQGKADVVLVDVALQGAKPEVEHVGLRVVKDDIENANFVYGRR
jgi:uncharacterized UPF0146 family protein